MSDSLKTADADDGSTADEKRRILTAAARAFEDGDYARVRRLTKPLFESGTEDAFVEEARDWFERTRPDPLVRYLLALTLGLLVAVTIFAYASEVP